MQLGVPGRDHDPYGWPCQTAAQGALPSGGGGVVFVDLLRRADDLTGIPRIEAAGPGSAFTAADLLGAVPDGEFEEAMVS
ncbi:hypothetical protein GCM10010330_35960 [Streptomyces tendae]|nr:hypothetical protein GCM10010330_35960 [Streptomyces tendae]